MIRMAMSAPSQSEGSRGGGRKLTPPRPCMIRMAMSAAKSRLEKTGERMAPRLFMRVATRNTY